MRIAVNALSVVPNETGGGETYLVELLRAMEEAPAGREHEVVVYCSENAAGIYRERGIVRRRVLPLDNRSRRRRLLFEHLRLGPLIKHEGADVVYAPGNALPLRLRLPNVLGIQSLHSFVVPEEMSRFRVAYFRSVVPRSARRADRILCVSEDIRRLLLAEVPGLDASKIRVVHEGAPEDIEPVGDDALVEAACGARGVARGRYLLFVSSLNPFKRPERAVQAVAAWRDRSGESWPLLLAGRASEEHTARVLAAAEECGVADLVQVLGTVGRSELAALLTGARAMLYPSTVETFGLPPLEAMACECPVVASDRTSIPEITGDAAMLVDPDDVGAFADALGRVLHDEALRSTLISRGRVRARHFRWSDAAAGTLAILEEAYAARVR